jgi:AcrR family transcriptional regulator
LGWGNLKKKSKASEKSKQISGLTRADARRNFEVILQKALEVFETSGVDAPVRDIAEAAGVGVGTLYRHFPERSDLIKAVVQQGVDACAEAAEKFANDYEPGEALDLWMQRLVDLLKTKKGLAAALHSGDPAYKSLPAYFLERLTPSLKGLLHKAEEAGVIKAKVDAEELLMAITRIAAPAGEGNIAEARRMVALLANGLRYVPKNEKAT